MLGQGGSTPISLPDWAVDHKPIVLTLGTRYDLTLHRVVAEVPSINLAPITEREMMLLKGREYLYGYEYAEIRLNGTYEGY
jgi:hypothetical protein